MNGDINDGLIISNKYTKLRGFLLLFFILLIFNVIIRFLDIFIVISSKMYVLTIIDIIYLFCLLYECILIKVNHVENKFYKLINISYILIALQVIYAVWIYLSAPLESDKTPLISSCAGGIIGIFIWIQYLFHSKRVKAYFNIKDDDEITEE
jgi:hypothetical protein